MNLREFIQSEIKSQLSESVNEAKSPYTIVVMINGERLAVDNKDIPRLKSGKEVVGNSLKYAGEEAWVYPRFVKKIEESVNESEQLDEKLITFSNRSPYGQIVFMAGGAGSGKGFAIDNFIDAAGFKVRDVDEMKKAVGKLDQLGKFSVDKWYKKYGNKLKPKDKAHVEEFVLGKGMTIADVAADLKNPNNVMSLHLIVDAMGLKDKWLINMLKGKQNKETLPNLLFDITAKKVGSITSVIKPLVDAGYDSKNIHLIWVLTNYHLAVKQNKERSRVVPDDILLLTHEGAAKTIWGILTGGLPKGLNGRIDVILNNRENTITYKDSKGNEMKGAVKGFKSLPIKKQGGGITPEKEWKKKLYGWVLDNGPKTVDLRKPLDTQMEESLSEAELGSDGHIYGHEGNPKLKHSKIYNSSNVKIKAGDYVIVSYSTGNYSAGVVISVSRKHFVYYEEERGTGRGLEDAVVVGFDEIGDIKKTGKKKWTNIPYPWSDDDNDMKGNVYIVTPIKKGKRGPFNEAEVVSEDYRGWKKSLRKMKKKGSNDDLHNRLIAAAKKVGGKLEGYDQTPINGKIKFYVDLGDGNPSYMNGFEMNLKTGKVSPSTPDKDAIKMNKIFSMREAEVVSEEYRWWTKGNPKLKHSPVDLDTYNKHNRKIMKALRKGKTYALHNYPDVGLEPRLGQPLTVKITWVGTKNFIGDLESPHRWEPGYDGFDFDYTEIESVKGNNIYHKGSFKYKFGHYLNEIPKLKQSSVDFSTYKKDIAPDQAIFRLQYWNPKRDQKVILLVAADNIDDATLMADEYMEDNYDRDNFNLFTQGIKKLSKSFGKLKSKDQKLFKGNIGDYGIQPF